ncbi:hypothetical protein CONPUDRAFT_65625 [Coniophora puteana RWD-64-598 SS2]|uniref:CxC5 like cysteine cluster associated with KDZ domain-containing protein n=1 Tax=Coniophora puteana (strain RWD-64-598) TaxID=741705 RepID=A0A5M3M8W1_CONPW|nr:uncharacterized protein CONPUDRAFT_65625 [Coniophora puteana RWD-64-598 SS2]EIW75649.1 hypothetical protein CONPUDRAFT_65625 [Coniophora puteana RWD-64-598 SS2]
MFIGDILHRNPILETIDFNKILHFIQLASELRFDIANVEDGRVNTEADIAPRYMPIVQQGFIARTVGIRLQLIPVLWRAFKDFIWTKRRPAEEQQQLLQDFEDGGWSIGITMHVLAPPSRKCTNVHCERKNLEMRAQDKQVRDAVVFTRDHGPQAAKAILLTCPACKTCYRDNYCVHSKSDTRTYYFDLPEFIQVGDHHFVETSMAKDWTDSMVVSHTSATNLATVYELSRTRDLDLYYSRPRISHRDARLPYSGILTSEQVWHTFVILALLRSHRVRRVPLSVPHDGSQRARFEDAMKQQNERVIKHGQPEITHYCDACMRIFARVNEDGERDFYKTQVVVADGLTIGHPCCKEFRCPDPLQHAHDHFCEQHYGLHNICYVTNCKRSCTPTATTSKTCQLEEHQEMERQSRERTTAMFALSRRREAQKKLARTADSTAPTAADFEFDDAEEWFEVDGAGQLSQHIDSHPVNIGVSDEVASQDQRACPGKTPRARKILLSRRRTACEVTFVRPCGVIVGRGTMFGAEAVSNVLDMGEVLFSVPGAQKPEHFIYDTACDAHRQARNRESDFWKSVGMCVDVWHLKNKHKTTHTYCRDHCNPADYPELKTADGKGWYFNTSIAEQVNVWLGGYQAIVREMLPTKYNFFLDEMVRLRNINTLESLKRKHLVPTYYPVGS